MKETIAENYTLDSFQEEEEEEAQRLSFCDLPMAEYNSSGSKSPRTSSAQTDHLFEFFVSQPEPAAHSKFKDTIFCGKIIHEDDDEDQLNEYQKRDYFATIKSHSFRKPSFSDHDTAVNRRLASSTRFSGDLARPKCDMDYHVQSVNITSLTSMSAKSRRRMFMFGPVKFKPEMELSAIKQRQAKRPAPAEKAAASGGGLMKSSLRGRSHLTSVLARSLGCIPMGGGVAGGERWVGLAN